MNRITLACAAICAVLFSACPALADAEEDAARERNVEVVKACLAIADAREETAMAAEAAPEGEKPDTSPQAYFEAAAKGAALAAGYARENCIGAVAGPCAEAGGFSLMTEHGCIGAEGEVWDLLLDGAYREALGLPPPDPKSDETPEEEAAKQRTAEPAPDCQPVSCAASANDNLRKTQRAFAAWRDAMCDQNYISSQGGRENQIEMSRCHTSLTARQYFWIEYGESFER